MKSLESAAAILLSQQAHSNHDVVVERKACKVVAAIVAPFLFAAVLLCLVLYSGTAPNQAARHNVRQLFSQEAVALQASGSGAAVSLSTAGHALVNTICKHTPYPAVCGRELSGFHIPLSTTPLDVASLALQATVRRVNEARVLATNCSSQRGLSLLEDQCANDCVELLYNAKDQMDLAAARLSRLGRKSSLASLKSALTDVKVWLSTSLSYQSVCTDNFQVAPGSIQHQIQNNQAYLTQVVGVSLSLVDILSQVGNDVAPWLGALPPSTPAFTHFRRRLLSDQNSVESNADFDIVDEFPRWVSGAERKLLQASTSSISANAVVAKDGSGQYTTITAAVNAIPKSHSGRYVIYIKSGTYKEVFNVTKDQQNVTFVGDGIGKTIITGSRNVASGDYNTYRTSTVGVAASGFYARDLTIRNTAGPSGHQAVALRAGADYMVFYRCSFEGYQDTLYALSSRQFYRECQISGTVDFIFGNAIAVFQNCVLLARLPMQGQQNTYTAQGRQLEADISGYSFQNCTVKADSTLQKANFSVSTYLGRPWKAYSRTVFLQSELQALIDPKGWLPWNASNPFTDTLYYGEYGNTGAGAGTSQRVTWKGVHSQMSKSDASQFTVTNFIAAQSWLDALKVPYKATL